jgi:hypothetical protein
MGGWVALKRTADFLLCCSCAAASMGDRVLDWVEEAKTKYRGSLHRAAHKSVISFGRDDMALGAAVIGEAG